MKGCVIGVHWNNCLMVAYVALRFLPWVDDMQISVFLIRKTRSGKSSFWIFGQIEFLLKRRKKKPAWVDDMQRSDSRQSSLKSCTPSFPFLHLKLVNGAQLWNITTLWVSLMLRSSLMCELHKNKVVKSFYGKWHGLPTLGHSWQRALMV